VTAVPLSQRSLDKDPARIGAMFDAIAPRYDLLNHLLSAGLDRYWRRRAIASLRLTGGETLADVFSGTGDMLLTALRARAGPARAVGLDFAGAMLERARQKLRRQAPGRAAFVVRADATKLPLPSCSIDAATVAFGIRNVNDVPAALGELCRIVRPGGRVAILEFGQPSAPGLRQLYSWYFRVVLPWVGRAISRHQSAYSYLPASVGGFPSGAQFASLLDRAGFTEVRSDPLALGIVYLYSAVRA
jgi:demethylmenaquinone methyltransferase/2-methoxy-6-polyprenyl-1,4-benzoquinol methylase